MLPTWLYGQIEYVFVCLKIAFLSIPICIIVVIAARQADHLRFWTWRALLGFSNIEWRLHAPKKTAVIHSPASRFLAFWTGVATCVFSPS